MPDPEDNENKKLDETQPVPPPPFEPKPPWPAPDEPDTDPPKDEWTAWTLGTMRNKIADGQMDAWLVWLGWAYASHYWIARWVKVRRGLV